MSTATQPDPPTTSQPTTVRLSAADVAALDCIRATTSITRNALIGLAITSLIDFVGRTGKLPVPQLKRNKRGGDNG